jgi:hypothetical protein
MGHVGIFYGHLVSFMTIRSIYGYFGIFFPFWYNVPRKIWQPRFRRPIWRHDYPTNFVGSTFRVAPTKLRRKCKNLSGRRIRVARFSLVHDTQTGKNVPNEDKKYQMEIKYTMSTNNTKGHKTFSHLRPSKN